jgi:S-adenosylmethionine decarboxylase
MDALGYHYLIELYDCNASLLENCDTTKKILHEAVKKSGATEIGQVFHQFAPHGISGVILISESHFSIHTWPEKKYAAIDLFTCDASLQIKNTYKYLISAFSAKSSSITEIKRGLEF